MNTPEVYVFGRPTVYKREYCQMLIDHMSEGGSFLSFGSKVNVTSETLYKWAEKYEDFHDAKKLAELKCLEWWESIAKRNMVLHNSKEGSTSFNSSVWIFNMKNRFKWRDKQPEEVTNITLHTTDAMTEKLVNNVKKMLTEKKSE